MKAQRKVTELDQLACPSDVQAPVLFTSSQSLLAQIPTEMMRDNEKADLSSGMYDNKT